ncbi:MAG: PDDEXK nuclease domain-containing protein [Oscillospiraceae bacterium]|jgi:predicted nuclease of restriction endonuclease-like (RecB) superfamily|nr:PDDEXK nuclease domain-containing protein [Oscillospiraceae bacterium]
MKINGNELIPNNNSSFEEIVNIIDRSRERVFRAINRELIEMYWEIGRYISEKVKIDKWGKSVVKEFADFVYSRYQGIQGFSASNIWRMRQFYETYCDNEKLAPLVREIGWTQNLIIMSRARSEEEREFYLLLCSKNLYSKRELERQINSALFERTMISNEQNQLFIEKSPALLALRDSYVLEFLDIPERHKEKELRKAIIANLRDFILEFGKDFTLVGEEYRVQVGNKDFKIDLLLYNRDLSCLVAIELKVTDFMPEHLGQLEFYLEALDRDVRKPNENPSVGLILCAGKDDEVVEYALSRSMSPALISEYQTHLPQKTLLASKLRELRELAEVEGLSDDDEGDGV